MKDTQK